MLRVEDSYRWPRLNLYIKDWFDRREGKFVIKGMLRQFFLQAGNRANNNCASTNLDLLATLAVARTAPVLRA